VGGVGRRMMLSPHSVALTGTDRAVLGVVVGGSGCGVCLWGWGVWGVLVAVGWVHPGVDSRGSAAAGRWSQGAAIGKARRGHSVVYCRVGAATNSAAGLLWWGGCGWEGG